MKRVFSLKNWKNFHTNPCHSRSLFTTGSNFQLIDSKVAEVSVTNQFSLCKFKLHTKC